MALTDGEIIDAALKFRVSAGSTQIQNDPALRARSRFKLQQLSNDALGEAPFWFKLGSGTITTVASQGFANAPTDFGYMNDETHLYSPGRTLPLKWADPDILQGFRQSAGRTGIPEMYTLQGISTTPGALGLPLFQFYPTPNAVYSIACNQYTKRYPDIVDRPGPFTAAVGGAGVLTGAYQWRLTFVTPAGETEAGTISPLLPTTGLVLATQQAALSNLPTSPVHRVSQRKLYRTTAGLGLPFKLVTTINDNTTTTFSDNVADGALGATAPGVNEAVTGMMFWPEDFHEIIFVYGLGEAMMEASGSSSDWYEKWRTAVKKRWAEHRQGLNFPQTLAPYGSVSGPIRETSWRFRIS